MSYTTISDMHESESLKKRVMAAAAEENILDPVRWVSENLWAVVSSPGWAGAWEYALAGQTLDHNPDTGVRPGVITDAMILPAVQAIIVENTPEPPA